MKKVIILVLKTEKKKIKMFILLFYLLNLTVVWNLGTGEEKIPNWYYDSDKAECTAFIYTGSEGNANRFETQEQCDRECGLFRDQVRVFSFFWFLSQGWQLIPYANFSKYCSSGEHL